MAVTVVVVYLVLLAFDLWLLLVYRDAAWEVKVGFLFQVLGLYTFAFGLVTRTEIARRFAFLTGDLTSPNLFRFAAGNMVLLAIATSAYSVALNPRKRPDAQPSGAFGTTAYLVASLLLTTVVFLAFVVWVIVYLVVIAPLAYLGYVVVSFPLREIEGSGSDIAIDVQGGSGEAQSVTMRELVASSRVELRNFLIAIPSLALSLVLQARTFF
jgi:hypothetical protein